MENQPTAAELVRRIEETARSIERLTATLESSYVRKEVYDTRHESLRREFAQQLGEVKGDVADLQDAKRSQDAFRRQILAGVLVGLFLMVAQIILVLTRIPGGGS